MENDTEPRLAGRPIRAWICRANPRPLSKRKLSISRHWGKAILTLIHVICCIHFRVKICKQNIHKEFYSNISTWMSLTNRFCLVNRWAWHHLHSPGAGNKAITPQRSRHGETYPEKSRFKWTLWHVKKYVILYRIIIWSIIARLIWILHLAWHIFQWSHFINMQYLNIFTSDHDLVILHSDHSEFTAPHRKRHLQRRTPSARPALSPTAGSSTA